MSVPVISSVLDLGKALIDRLIPDPKAKSEALQKLAEMEQAGDLAVIAGQIEINKIEAASSNVFIAGWRPFIGWVCGSALACQLVLFPMAEFGAAAAGRAVALPTLNTELLTTMVISMLGLGGLRTAEKMKGVAAK